MSQLEKTHLLIVDDSPTIRNTIATFLGDDYITLHASNGEEAWNIIKTNGSVSLIFADLHMPVMNGMALLKRVRSSKNKRIANLPIIMITGHEDSEAAQRASYNMGASDFIKKPFSEIDIISRVNSYLQLSQKIATLEKNVSHDDLTGLYNVNGYKQQGEQALASSARHDFDLSILTMQIVNIEEILKKYGRKITSQIIVAVSNNLKKSLRKEESLAHIGMGQFSMLLTLTKVFRAKIVAERFQKSVSNMVFKIGDEEVRLSLALGLNSTEEYSEEISFSQFSEHAESAMRESLNSVSLKIVTYANKPASNLLFDSTLKLNVKNVDIKDSVTDINRQSFSSMQEDDFQFVNSAVFSRYMSMILNGDFNKIPRQDLIILAEPLRSFVRYVDTYKHTRQTEKIE